MLFVENLKKIEQRFTDMENQLANPEIVKDQAKFQSLRKETARLRPVVEAWQSYQKIESELGEISRGLEAKDTDPELRKLYLDEKVVLDSKKTALAGTLEDLLLKDSDPNSGRDVIVEIRAGTGGEEAALFVADLFRMYTKFAAEHGLQIDLMSSNPTGKGGFKEIIFGVGGTNAYSLFKYEKGIHRVQRVPETEASGRIHTSASTVAIMAEADETEIEIDPKDLKIDVFRASGAGGQHVNKTESAVRITHIPTGLVVSCQDERSQHKNKTKAMRVLRARLYEARQQKQQESMAKERREQVGSGDRSGKIRTYNFPDQRVTDHRIGLTLHSLDDILNGHLDELVKALEQDEKNRKLTETS